MFSGSQVDTYEAIDGHDKVSWCVFRRNRIVSAYYHCHVHPSVCSTLCVYQHSSHWGGGNYMKYFGGGFYENLHTNSKFS